MVSTAGPAGSAAAGTPRDRLRRLHRVRRIAGLLRVLLAATIFLPVAIFVLFALRGYHTAVIEAEQLAQRTIAILQEHVSKVLETQELILDKVEALAAGRSWAEIAADPGIAPALRRIAAGRRQIVSIWLFDAQGDVRASSHPKAGLNASGFEFFQVLRRGRAGTHIGAAYTGWATGLPAFGFARSRAESDGSFGGVALISMSASYFSDFFRSVVPSPDYHAVLFRTDGSILAQQASGEIASPLPLDHPLMHADDGAVIWQEAASDGISRLHAHRRIDGYPVTVGFTVTSAAALEAWRDDLIYDGVIAGTGCLGLLLALLLALRRVRSEEAARQQLYAEVEQRAQLESMLRQSQKLEVLGQLTGSVAHDFSNLLNVISGNLQMVRDRIADPGNPSRLSSALAAADRCASLIGSLLAFVHRQPLSTAVLDLNAVIAGMDELLRQSLGGGIELALTLAPDLWLIESDPVQVEMAILNLAVNARDAMPGGGKLRIATANCRLAGEPDGLQGEFVALSVMDTGTGMAEEALAHAFEPFFTTKGPRKGTGLGLSSVRGLATRSGGAARIASTPGKGTTVTLLFPRHRPVSATA